MGKNKADEVKPVIPPNLKQEYAFSIVIPTYERCDMVLRCVASFTRQEFSSPFEVIVVVDGSTDNSADALRRLTTPFVLRVVEQANQGPATARNHGAFLSSGERILFVDDDMQADRRLLAEHAASYASGADAVLGHMPLDPECAATILSDGVRRWADRRLARLSVPDAELILHDLLTGQMSVRQEIFRAAGGFKGEFTRGESFGNEDIDFAYRLIENGYRVIFNPHAITWQTYSVTPQQFLHKSYGAGRSDVLFARRHPEHRETLFVLNGALRRSNRWVWKPAVSMGVLTAPFTGMLRWAALRLYPWGTTTGLRGRLISRLFFHVRDIEYWKGVRDGGGIPGFNSIRVLCYHAIQDLSKHGTLSSYGTSLADFRRQLITLLQTGYHFISGDEFLRFHQGSGGVPKKAVLLTFDDCYDDLDEVLTLLQEFGIPAIAFAVSGLIGASNAWDQSRGMQPLRLLDAAGLCRLQQAGIEIGAHSRTHANLAKLQPEQLEAEITGSVEDLQKAGVHRPRFFAYPYGEYNETVVNKVRDAAGLQAAFTVRPGQVRSGEQVFEVPRIEILRSDTGWRFRWKVAFAGRPVLPHAIALWFARWRRFRHAIKAAYVEGAAVHPPGAGELFPKEKDRQRPE